MRLTARELLLSRFLVSLMRFIYEASGYAGYIPGVQSENLFGQTYGKTSFASSAGSFHRGIDQPADVKFNTMMKSEFIDHATQSHDTIAKIVGVDRDETRFTRVSIAHVSDR